MQGLVYEESSLLVFVLVTVLLGGAGAWLSGRAIARTWRPWWAVVQYMLLLGLAVRFVHYALFGGTLLSAHYYLVDTAILILIGLAGFRATRRRQMARQYGFLARPEETGRTTAGA
ncbi:Hypothetical protein A33M_4359 [Rhodovulum sp. PH10]|uniref:DUF6867 family protein n=1 Tax=Rhodovulum sp. PH10 TaxID=1187851 RepID=UPI00027C2DC3|nr:hypothetical protein [Rhodovulum sp. PH10]EJW10522.1 Hypothetical protein A33M_4359 [Rhodovulum sp. PH10]